LRAAVRVDFLAMKFFIFLYCVAIILPGCDIVVMDASPFESLGLGVSPLFYLSPIILSVAIYFIMTFRLEKKTEAWWPYFKKNHVLWRVAAVFLAVFILSTSLDFYKHRNLGEVLLPEWTQNENLLNLQKKLDFKITWGSSSADQGTTIYFAQVPGRKEKIEAALAGDLPVAH
jgi:hypothetical protein